MPPSLALSPAQHELQAHLRRRNLPARVAQRIRMVLMLSEGSSYSEMQEKLEIAATTVSRGRRRCEEAGVEPPSHPGEGARRSCRPPPRCGYSRLPTTTVLRGDSHVFRPALVIEVDIGRGVQGLNGALFIHTEHGGMLGRMQGTGCPPPCIRTPDPRGLGGAPAEAAADRLPATLSPSGPCPP